RGRTPARPHRCPSCPSFALGPLGESPDALSSIPAPPRPRAERDGTEHIRRMYYAIVAAFMFILPVGSIAVEVVTTGSPAYAGALVAKWFAFWSVGWRLFLAGVRQVTDPSYTARTILGLDGDESFILVRELGFANLSLGALGVLSMFVPAWRLAAAL